MNIFEKQKVGKDIKKIRADNNISIDDFAKIWNVSKHNVEDWEKGVNLPNLKKIDKILNYDYKPKMIAKSNNKTKKNTVSGYQKLQADLKNNNKTVIKNKVNNNGRRKYITEQELLKAKEEAKQEAIDLMYVLMFAIPMQILREQGWGKVRLQRFNDELTAKLSDDSLSKKKIDDLVLEMKERYGITFRG